MFSSQLFDRENLATALDDLLFISSDAAGNLGQFLELNKLSEILLTHRQINFKAEEKSYFSPRDLDCSTNSAAHQDDVSSGLIGVEIEEEKKSEIGTGTGTVRYGSGSIGVGGDRGEKNDDTEGSSNGGARVRRRKGREEEERKKDQGGVLLAIGERKRRDEEEEEDEEGEETDEGEEEEEEEGNYRVVDGTAEGVTDAKCILYTTAVRKDYAGFLFLRPDLYTAVSDPCLQVRRRRGG